MTSPTFRDTGQREPSPSMVHDSSGDLGARAFELAASVDRALDRHLDECTNRYEILHAKFEELNKLLFRALGAMIMLLLSILGWLLTH